MMPIPSSILANWIIASCFVLFFCWMIIDLIYLNIDVPYKANISSDEREALERKVKQERKNYLFAILGAGGLITFFLTPIYFDIALYDKTFISFLGSLIGLFSFGQLIPQFLAPEWKATVRGSWMLIMAGISHQLAQTAELDFYWTNFFKVTTFFFLAISFGTLIYVLLIRDKTGAITGKIPQKQLGKFLAALLLIANLIQFLDAILNHFERFLKSPK